MGTIRVAVVEGVEVLEGEEVALGIRVGETSARGIGFGAVVHPTSAKNANTSRIFCIGREITQVRPVTTS